MSASPRKLESANAGEGTLRDRKKASVLLALSESAFTLFEERGFPSVTTNDIAAHAGVSRRSFFRYFATKEDVVLGRRAREVQRLELALREARASRPIELVQAALLEVARDTKRDRRQVLRERALIVTSRDLLLRDLELDRAFEEAIARALVERFGSKVRREVRFFAAATMGIVRVAFDEWARGKGGKDLDALGRPAFVRLSALSDAIAGPTTSAAEPPSKGAADKSTTRGVGERGPRTA